ncbi:MAG: inositol monophosphatase family protein [Ktedonobacteraceae bacterium]
MLELLEQLFRQVRAYMHSEHFNRQQIFEQSSEHTTMQFDREAEDLIIEGLTASGHGFEVITEERPLICTSEQPAYRIVVDPVDGSTNVARGILSAGVSLAVLPIDAPVTPEYVQWALVGELYSGTVYQAECERGAYCNGRRCQVSEITRYQDCLAGINLDRRDASAVQRLLCTDTLPAGTRRSGSSAMDLVYVASGAYDAYVDIGEILTGESFLAAAMIVREAGGLVTDAQGQPLVPIKDLRQGFSLVAAATPVLHNAILQLLAIRD